MNLLAALGAAILLCGFGAMRAQASTPTALRRIEARGAHYRLVGLLRADTMDIHVSRILDNTPVSDAQVTVEFRGRTYATTASIDGGYAFSAPQLRLPGSAAIAFEIAAGGVDETLRGVVRMPDGTGRHSGHGGARQLGWWVLNFAVCIGFLALIARRRKRDADD